MLMTASTLLGLALPSLNIIGIILFASCLPILFFLFIKVWLALPHSNDENPDRAVQEQAKMDEEHLAHSHGHDHGHGHAHAHAHGHHHH